ncbi:MAG: tRNA epoxyqueuosine(34) reductase QueG [Anaerolineae bacterium]
MTDDLKIALKTQAQALGFSALGVVEAAPSPTLAAYERWIDAGMHGSMGYLARPDRVARRRNLNVILPQVRSIVVVVLDYAQWVAPQVLNDPARGRIASYAWGVDYHEVMTPRLKRLAAWLGESSAVYVDTGAILERSHAQQAGLGFIGKNTMLIHPRRGSYFFIGEILTTAALEPDPPHTTTMCGRCTRCLVACPTDAFPAPYVLDARRCISYHTIENKGSIPEDLRASFGNWVYGCDVCQEVCPWQRFSTPTQEEAFHVVDVDRAAPPLAWLLTMTPQAFSARFAGSAILRTGYERMVRNACIAAGNSGDPALKPLLAALTCHPSPLIAQHAAWALGR